MPPTTQPPKTQSSSPESTKSHELDKKDLGSDADAKAKSEDHKNVTIEELQRIYRESCERVDKMTPEERLKAFPWIKDHNSEGTPAHKLPPDFWDYL